MGNKFYIFVIIVLSTIIFVLSSRGRRVEIVEKHHRDTITIVKIDTIVKYKTKYITERITDTIYVEKKGDDNRVALLRLQRHFQEPNLFDAWVSGYDPMLDSIKVYPKTEYHTITNEVVKEITPLTWKLYLGGGFQSISSTFAPYVSVSLATPKKWLFSAKIGLYEKELLYGVEVSYKILGK